MTAWHHALYLLGIHSLHSPVGASDMTDFFNHLKLVLFGNRENGVDVGISTENDDLLLPVVIRKIYIENEGILGEVIYFTALRYRMAQN